MAKVIAFGLTQAGVRVKILSRKQVAKFNNSDFDILVNATPVADKLLIPDSLITKDKVVFEVIYAQKTKLEQLAKRRGCATVSGLDMLKYQWERQYSLVCHLD